MNALREIKEEVAQTKNKVGGMASQLTLAFAAVGGAITAVKGALSTISGISNAAAEMEQTGLALRVMMGDATAAAAYLVKLRQYAAETPFEFPDIANAAKVLLSMGTDANKSVEVIKKLGDVASVSGKPLKDLAFLYAKVQNSGLSNEVAESLEMQGVPIRKLLAEMKGISFEQVFQGISKRQFDISDLDAVLAKMTGPGGLLENMTKLQSKTFSGALSTLTDNIGALGIALGTPVNAAILPVMEQITAAIDAMAPQVQQLGETLAACFSGAAAVISPLVSGFGTLVSSLGGVKTVVAAVVAGLLMYSGQTQAASASTISFKAQVAQLSATLRSISMESVVATIKAQVAQLSATLRSIDMASTVAAVKMQVMQLSATFKTFTLKSFKAMFKGAMLSVRTAFSSTLVGIRVAWSTAWATMVAVTKTAMLAIKASIVSTGIGLIIVGIGEALGALYSWFVGNSQAAEEAAEANKRFEASLRDMERSAAKVKTQEQYDAFMEQLQTQIDELRALREEAYQEEDWDKGEQLTAQLDALWKKQAHYRQTLPLQIEQAKAAERAAEAMREQARQAEELEEKQEKARKKMEELVAAQKKKEREDYLSGLDIPQQIQLRLSDVGFSSLEDLRREMQRMATHEIYNPEDAERYARLVETYNKIVELKKQQAKLDKEEAKTAAKKQEEDKKKKQEIAESRAEYERKLAILRAETAEDEKRLAILKAEQRLAELTAEYRRQGFEDAEAMARKMLIAELEAAEVREKEQKKEKAHARRMSAAWIQSSLASVGGGGYSFLVGGEAMLSESKKHTSLLREVRDGINRKTGPLTVTTVIGK